LIEILLGALLFVLVIAFVIAPLRRAPSEDRGEEDPRVADLESRKEAKYREIRDTQLDHAAGKLSDQDYRRQDAELRHEAVEILNQLERARADRPE
jgi:flagellar biosynthesis/type III secretory pathway M-ring protein FliF/YscJ